MSETSCRQLAEISAELALGILSGHERAQALVHLSRCPRCREHVRQLTAVSESLLKLVPGAEPPVGCENRVMERLTLTPSHPRRQVWKRALAGAAAALTLAGFGIGGWSVGAATHPDPAVRAPQFADQGTATVATGTLTSPDRGHVGQIYVYPGQPSWVYMTVDIEGTTGTVSCQLQRKDGTFVTVGSFRLVDGYGSWGGPTRIAAAQLTSIRLVDAHGVTLATAR